MLRPSRRRDVEVHVARLQTEPVHRRQVSDRIAHVSVLDQLRFRRGARREVQEQRVIRGRRSVRREGAPGGREVVVRHPFLDRIADRDAGQRTGDVREAVGQLGLRDDVSHPTPLDAVGDVRGREQRARGNHHRAQLGEREDALPELGAVTEHEQGPVAPAYAVVAQPAGERIGPRAQLGERQSRLDVAVIDDPEARPIIAGSDGVEPIEAPVEGLGTRPPKLAVRRLVVGAVPEQEVAGGLEFHARSLLVVGSGTLRA